MLPRPFTCCCAVLAISSGFFLYAKKHQTTLLDQKIAGIVHETEHVRAQTAMLRTEWTLENQPERLTALAAHHAAYLRIMEPTQFVRMADLSNRLPAPLKENEAAPTPVAMADTPASQSRALPPVQPSSAVQHVQPEHVERVSVASSAAPAVIPAARPVPERPVMTVASAAPVSHPAPAPVQHVSATPVAPAPATRVRVADAGNGSSLLAAIQAAGTHHTQPVETPHATARAEAAEQADMDVKPRIHATPAAPTRVVAARSTTTDEPSPIRHPLPATVASWHPHLHRAATSGGGYMEARASSGYMGGSLLGRGGDSLPPPVPVTN